MSKNDGKSTRETAKTAKRVTRVRIKIDVDRTEIGQPSRKLTMLLAALSGLVISILVVVAPPGTPAAQAHTKQSAPDP